MAYEYRIAISQTAADLGLSGTVAVSSPLDRLTGTGTAFLTGTPFLYNALRAGDVVFANGEARLIESVDSDTQITVVTNFSATFSGVTYAFARLRQVEYLINAGANVEVTVRNCAAPKGVYTPFSQVKDLGAGARRGYGRPSAKWVWGFVSKTNRNRLKTYSTGSSRLLYIKTMRYEDEDEFGVYEAIMLWPYPDENREMGGFRMNFEAEFRNLVEIT